VHALISRDLDLDRFDDMLNEANESTSLVSFHGRIILHVRPHAHPTSLFFSLFLLCFAFFSFFSYVRVQAIFELVYDFFPNYCYNSITNRFIRSPVKGGDVPRESMPKSKIPFMYGSRVRTFTLQMPFFWQLYGRMWMANAHFFITLSSGVQWSVRERVPAAAAVRERGSLRVPHPRARPDQPPPAGR
jgi:cytoplasmic FMR1 interacting protein